LFIVTIGEPDFVVVVVVVVVVVLTDFVAVAVCCVVNQPPMGRTLTATRNKGTIAESHQSFEQRLDEVTER